MNPSVSDRLRAWRKHLGLTQEEFSSLTGLNIGVIRKYENGINVPGGEALITYGQTGVNLHWLLMGQGEMCPDATSPACSMVNDPYERRAEAVKNILDGLDESRRDVVLEEIFSRVQEAKRIADLEDQVRDLTRKIG